MNRLAAKALEIVEKYNSSTPEPNETIKPKVNLNYKDLVQYIRIMDLKGVVDVFGDVKGDKHAAHQLAEFCILRWDMTPEIFEYVKQYLISPLNYPVVYDAPDRDHVYAEDFDNEWKFKQYCRWVELKIKTKAGWIMKAPFVDAPLKLAGINAFMYASRHVNAKFASPLKLHQSNDIFDRLSYYFHTHNPDIGSAFAAYKFDAKSIKYLDHHFEICTEGEACSINRIIKIITGFNPDFVVPMIFKVRFETITGRVPRSQSANKTITNESRQSNKQRGKKYCNTVIANDA